MGTSQGVYYSITGVSPNQTAAFEYYESSYSNPNAYYHFLVVFYESLPGIVKFIYYQAATGGSSATIGVQSEHNAF